MLSRINYHICFNALFPLARVAVLVVLMALPFEGFSQQAEIQSLIENATEARIEGDYSGALAYLERAQLLTEESGDSTKLSEVLLRQSFVHIIQSENGKALTALFRAQKINEKLIDEAGLAEVFTYIGALYHGQGDHETADRYYSQSLDLYSRLNMPRE